ncbi:hypothetical protein Ga0074812_115165 [Parafrankia irregularis]|uniref:Uncharacterized protein n=1 Tax=Parafrankia irregularis TaxID=795642 RepID=A0A0S4QQG9_9ACTN|nr:MULTISPECIES: hypothetical protein [Parafrankia]MBE3202771.1 hypothetical protein [Parafrankia sp. CH37]CUU57963.1 hypothetical protein Ga0074812_115165 [Parafrankia irregularis]
MNTIAKLSAFGAALTLVFGGAYGVGTAVGPLDAATTSTDHDAATAGGHGGDHSGAAPDLPGTVGHGTDGHGH